MGAATAAAAADAAVAAPAPAPAPAPEATAALARFASTARFEDLPPEVLHQGRRTFVNWLGCAVGGARHEAVSTAAKALLPFAGRPQAQVLGRAERTDIVTAALLNGIASHVFDYDDTHLKTIIHPAGPVAPAVLVLAEQRGLSGAAALHALVLGVEAECRIGNAVYPEHYAAGWHITGTCGPFGAAVACGKLIGLTEPQFATALGIAASQPVGLKIQFGAMTKSFHPGRAAQNGLTAALLAEAGFTAAPAALEGKDGWGGALSSRADWSEVTRGLGQHWEAALNSYKPFACGIVIHPALDAAIQLRAREQANLAALESIHLRVHPLVQSLTGKTDPQTGLEGKFSVFHAVAAGVIEGAGGERQFSDRAVRDPTIVALRRRVSLTLDPATPTEACILTARFAGGRTVTIPVEHAIGSLTNPLSDAALDAKFLDLAGDVLTPPRARRVLQMAWSLDSAPSVSTLARAASARG